MRNYVDEFRHENMSIKIIDKLYNDNNIKATKDEIELIKALISPSTHMEIYNKYKDNQREWLFEIICNERTGMDVDKWDYIIRDSKNCNINTCFNYQRLLQHLRVINGQFVWHEKTAHEMYLLFSSRYDMFKRVYSHKVTTSIEYMIVDAMKLANNVYKIVEKTKKPDVCGYVLYLSNILIVIWDKYIYLYIYVCRHILV